MVWGTNMGSALGLSPPLASVSPAHKPTSDALSKLLQRHQACTSLSSPSAHQLVANGPLPFLCPKEIKLNLQKEITLAKAKHSIADLFRTPTLRRVTSCLSLAW